jgi:hypothetical protein
MSAFGTKTDIAARALNSRIGRVVPSQSFAFRMAASVTALLAGMVTVEETIARTAAISDCKGGDINLAVRGCVGKWRVCCDTVLR